MVPPSSDRISRVPPYSSSSQRMHLRIRGYHPVLLDFPDRFPDACADGDSGLFPVRSPLLGESRLISFPKGTEMFHFPSFARHGYVFTLSYQLYWWVSPFGNLRIKVCVPLPEAYRSLPRPSSLPSAKAFTVSS